MYDNIVMEVALSMGWLYDGNLDFYRKRMPNGDEIAMARYTVINLARSNTYHDIEEVFLVAMEKYKGDTVRFEAKLNMVVGDG